MSEEVILNLLQGAAQRHLEGFDSPVDPNAAAKRVRGELERIEGMPFIDDLTVSMGSDAYVVDLSYERANLRVEVALPGAMPGHDCGCF